VPAPWELGLQPDWVLLVPASGQVLYRVGGKSAARERDFQSDRDKTRPRYVDQTYVDHLGLSMFESEELAEASATNFPKFIVSVRLEPERGFMLARTESEIEGHFSVWGDPESLLESVEGPVTRRLCERRSYLVRSDLRRKRRSSCNLRL
jgi:hypothetical protein